MLNRWFVPMSQGTSSPVRPPRSAFTMGRAQPFLPPLGSARIPMVSWLVCGVVIAACDPNFPPEPPPTPEEQAKAAADARSKAETQFRELVSHKEYVVAAQLALSERLFDDKQRPTEVRKLIASRAGEVEGMAHYLDRMNAYGELAGLVRKAELPMDLAQQYAASAFRSGATIDNLDVVQNAVLHAKEFDVEAELRQRAAARVWAMRIDHDGWPAPGTQSFVDQFPLSGGFASTAYSTAMDLGRWKAARMIAERARLGDELFHAARTKEVEELVAAAIRARDDQRLLQINLEAPGYVDASVVKTVASYVVGKLIAEGKPGEAYGLALAHGLDVSDAKRAADAFFSAAIKKRTFSLARQMPDGTFIIVEQPPPPPPVPATRTPSPQFEQTGRLDSGGH